MSRYFYMQVIVLDSDQEENFIILFLIPTVFPASSDGSHLGTRICQHAVPT